MTTFNELAAAIRVLTMDAVERAQSGHPGMPMGMADIATVLWREFLEVNPANPRWPNRDRFILSNGHGAMLLYAVLHLTGFALSIDDIKQFRQLNSKTPGHPEYGLTPGVETTTGPLGQGIANAVGMAVAEKHLSCHFNRPGYPIIDHYTYTFLGDGCLMEGISHEACALAGVWGLHKLICFWDDNGISLDGKVNPWFAQNTVLRFKAYGWQVIEDIDGHDPDAIRAAIKQARSNQSKPSLICCKTVIGRGAPQLAGTTKIHGAPLGEVGIKAAKDYLQWSTKEFEIPAAIYEAWDQKQKGQLLEKRWRDLFNRYQQDFPDMAREWQRRMQADLPENYDQIFENLIQELQTHSQSYEGRKASQYCLNHFAEHIPEIIGGSADVTAAANTQWGGAEYFSKNNPSGRYIQYGVREFGMSAIANGMVLYGGLKPYVAAFLTFSDYARNAIRMAALMKINTLFVYTHDSIGLGQDGPTHQPIEHLTSLRAIPNLHLWRPCDAVEVACAWKVLLQRQVGPACLVLSRQLLASQTHSDLAIIERGGYILLEPETEVRTLIIATGSEVQLAVAAANEINQEGYSVRVVSMPCVELFLEQPQVYQEQILPAAITQRLIIEAGTSMCWHRFIDGAGKILSVEEFGKSAPGEVVMQDFNYTVAEIKRIIKEYDYKECSSYV